MEWIILFVCVAAVLVLFGVKKMASISPDAAQKLLKQGARIIDVRSPEEYQARHLPGAINIPGNTLEKEIGRYAPDKNQVLLLHCLSGGRSGLGTQVLRRLGYKNTFNLGSYGRAEKIVSGGS